MNFTEQKLYRGSHLVQLDVSLWPEGIYVCEIRTEKQMLTKKVMVVK